MVEDDRPSPPPGDMLEDLNGLEDRARRIDIGPLVTVVDAPKFTRLQQILGEFYEEQVENADVLVLNKIDLAKPEGARGSEGCGPGDQSRRHTACSPSRATPTSPCCSMAPRACCSRRRRRKRTATAITVTTTAMVTSTTIDDDHHHHGHHHHEHGHAHAHAHAPAESFVMDASGDFSRAGLVDAFASMPDNVWRSKGFLTVDGESSLLQFTMGQLEIESAPARERPYLVVIGEELDRRVVEDAVLTARRTASE